MATWTLTGQRTDGTSTVTIDPSVNNHIWFTSGINITDNVVVGNYQVGTHASDSTDAHLAACGGVGGHINNTMFVSSTNVNINGGGSVALSATVPTAAQMPFKFNFSDAAAVATSGAKFYATDSAGVDANAWAGVTIQAFEKTNTTWTACNTLTNALALANQAAATSHDFLIGVSVTPTSTGAKTGKLKITVTYV